MADSETLQQILAVIGELKNDLGGLHSEISGLRDEMRSEISGLRDEMRSEISGLRGEMRSEISGLRGEMQAGFDKVQGQFDQVHDELREIRAIQDAQGKEITHLITAVDAIDRKLARVGEILR